MIVNISTHQVGQTLGTPPLSHPDPESTHAQNDLDASLQVDFADLINRAKQAAETDADAIEKALELFQSGELTSEARVRSAAESILTLGI